jgi:hypothetical protein
MTWKKGASGNPDGSNYRSRRLLNQEFIQALLLHFRNEGKRAIERVAKEQPGTYVKILALLVPREMKLEHTNPISSLSDEQLDAMIAHFQTSLAARAGDLAKVIQSEGVETTAARAPGLEQPKRPNRLLEHVDTAIGPRERKPKKSKVPPPPAA